MFESDYQHYFQYKDQQKRLHCRSKPLLKWSTKIEYNHILPHPFLSKNYHSYEIWLTWLFDVGTHNKTNNGNDKNKNKNDFFVMG